MRDNGEGSSKSPRNDNLHSNMGGVCFLASDAYTVSPRSIRIQNGLVVGADNKGISRCVRQVLLQSSRFIDIDYTTMCWIVNRFVLEAVEEVFAYEVIDKFVLGGECRRNLKREKKK